MNSIAQQALNRALSFPVSARKVVSRPAPVPLSQPATIPVPKISAPDVIDEPATEAPYNHFMYLEGRHFAVDLVRSMSALTSSTDGHVEIVANLRRSAADRPSSYAKGIYSIIDLIEAAT